METFESYRRLMFSIAYRMLGSATDAEDIVQDAYLRYQAAKPERVQSPKAYFSTIVTRLCLDRLKSAREQRETYIGPWLPEPIITTNAAFVEPEKEASVMESVSMAFLMLLENLSPLERAVFLLREVFDYDYGEIAEIVGREEAACRQLFSRAKKHVTENRPRFKTSPEEHNRLVTSFIQATAVGELEGLVAVLAEDVTLWSDGGGKVQAATHPIHGQDAVARFLIGIQRFAQGNEQADLVEINGETAIVVRRADGTLIMVITLETGDGLIRALRIIRNPDKLKHLT